MYNLKIELTDESIAVIDNNKSQHLNTHAHITPDFFIEPLTKESCKCGRRRLLTLLCTSDPKLLLY